MIKQVVDPLIQQAIQEAVDKEGLMDWAKTEDPTLPPYKATEIKKPITIWAFLNEIKQSLTI